MSHLTPEQIQQYRSQGYLAVPEVLSQSEVAELRTVTDEFVERSRSLTTHDDVYDLEPGHSSSNPLVRRLKGPHLRHPIYDKTLRHPGVLDVVADLIGPDLRCNSTKLNMKSADVGSPVEWHQDWAFYPHTNDDILAVGVAIDEMTTQNGCLLVVPGSHNGPLHSHHQDGVFVGAVTDAEFPAERTVPIVVPAGGISIHHVRLLHASAPNWSKAPRRLLLLEVCAADAWPLMGFGTLEEMTAKMVRGTLSLQPRVENVPVRMPLPKHERAGSIYEVQSKLAKKVFV